MVVIKRQQKMLVMQRRKRIWTYYTPSHGVAEGGVLFLGYFLLLSSLFCYSEHLDFLMRLKGGAILCYFLLF